MDGGTSGSLREVRLSEVDELVSGVRGRRARKDGAAAPDAAGRPLSLLRSRLRVAHGRCDAVDGESWAGYVAQLDRGIDELHVELTMAAETKVAPTPGAPPTLDDVLLARTSAIELDAWRLAAEAELAGPGGADLRPALTAAEESLRRYREELALQARPSRAALETAMAQLRQAGAGREPADAAEAPATPSPGV